MNDWPPKNFDPSLPADFQGQFDPGNSDEELFDEDGNLIMEDDEVDTDE